MMKGDAERTIREILEEHEATALAYDSITVVLDGTTLSVNCPRCGRKMKDETNDVLRAIGVSYVACYTIGCPENVYVWRVPRIIVTLEKVDGVRLLSPVNA